MSTFGTYFRVTTFGESHCAAVGVVVDGCPPRLPLDAARDIQPQLSRRRPGQSALTTARSEDDTVSILSGTENGVTLGTPIALVVRNHDQRPGDYSALAAAPRPSHADYTYNAKYGIHAASGGGRSSARETIGRVAAGAVAETWLRARFGVEIVAWVSSIGNEHDPMPPEEQARLTRADVEENSPVRCAHASAVSRMARVVEQAREDRDSIGGSITCVCRGVPVGWGEPVFDKLEAMLAHAMLSIPATKGFEIGSGFQGTAMRGSQHNDLFVRRADGTLGTATNNSGGVQGGVSNGEYVVFRVAFKPPATIGRAQDTCDYQGRAHTMEAKGRHDPCVVTRAVVIVEAMAALVLADCAMAQLARQAAAETPVSASPTLSIPAHDQGSTRADASPDKRRDPEASGIGSGGNVGKEQRHENSLGTSGAHGNAADKVAAVATPRAFSPAALFLLALTLPLLLLS